jgi:uncharacterized protein
MTIASHSPQSMDARAERFSFVCNRCLRCCSGKRIQVNPYEVARIAWHHAVTTTECRERWTVDGEGIELAQTDSGACVFLGPIGCTVHADRPLVCRLYPLGRHVASDGSESYSHIAPHPETASEISDQGTIREFLETQGAAPFLRAADDYYFWICHAQIYRGRSDRCAASWRQ